MWRTIKSLALTASLFLAAAATADEKTDELAKQLRSYAEAELAKVPGKDGKFSSDEPERLNKAIARANNTDRETWAKIRSKEDWEALRKARIQHLRTSLGHWPEPPKQVRTKVTKTIEAVGYRIDNLLYESRPGLWVAGNLYRPAEKRERMPVILIAHSHHAPKHEGELQDMGVTWAKLGCMVLVIDQLGHGERRQHPFVDKESFPRPFRVGRQDYYFRYNLNLQLSLVGDSLMGWMAWDLMRGLDVLLAQPGADPKRVILLGSVAGGGDPAAVTAALDERIQCVVPFNFGGPQPETRYPLPESADATFNYVGGGSWESTRNLRDSASNGTPPWLIVAAVAPRRLIHAHEFSWDRERDPVWKRYQKIWGFYGAGDNLAFTHGKGVIQGNDPTASHCNNIGPIHRKAIHEAFAKWFGVPVPEAESRERRSAKELQCWTPEAERELKPRPLHELLLEMADQQAGKGKRPSGGDLAKAFGQEIDYLGRMSSSNSKALDFDCKAWSVDHRWGGHVCREIGFEPKEKNFPVVQCIAHEGADRFLKERATAIATLVRSGVGVVLVDLPGAGSRRPGDGRGRTSWSASLHSTGLMVNATSAAEQLCFADWLWRRIRMGMHGDNRTRMAVWAESFASANAENIAVPHDLAQPHLAEPFAATVAATLDAKIIVARGGLASFRSVLESPFVHVPHDALPIDIFRAGDLPERWAQTASQSLRLEGLVDGTNRRLTTPKLESMEKRIREGRTKGDLVIQLDYSSDRELAEWLVARLKK